jgi:hypothetical protein
MSEWANGRNGEGAEIGRDQLPLVRGTVGEKLSQDKHGRAGAHPYWTLST